MAESFTIDPKKPHAFLSYTHSDDEYLGGGITDLRSKLELAIKANTGTELKIFQDVEDIVPGDRWKNKLNVALENAQVFIPVLTPSFFKSKFCRRETHAFLDYEKRAGRVDLIVPIYLLGTGFWENDIKKSNDVLFAALYERQYHDWRKFSFKLTNKDTQPMIAELAFILANVAQRPAKTEAISSATGKQFGLEEAVRSGLRRRTYVKVGRKLESELEAGGNSLEKKSPKETEAQRDGSQPSTTVRTKNFSSDSEYVELPNKSKYLNNQYAGQIREREDKKWILYFVKRRVFLNMLWLIAGAVVVGLSITVLRLMAFVNEEPPSRIQPQRDNDLTTANNLRQPFRDCAQCPEMMALPTGEFMMGSPLDEKDRDSDEGPQRNVTIKTPFAIGVYEVTLGEFAQFVDATGHKGIGCRYFDGSQWKEAADRDWFNPGFLQTDEDPVVCVSWEDAKSYARWLSRKTGQNYRLPSEAEWEYAARAGSETPYPWGGELEFACNHANGHDQIEPGVNRFRQDWGALPCDDGYAQTAPVGSFNANSFGLHDMVGNVWEWVEDSWHTNYDEAPLDSSPWIDSEQTTRVLRGGSWSYNPENLRSANRRSGQQIDRNAGDGFRVVRTLDNQDSR